MRWAIAYIKQHHKHQYRSGPLDRLRKSKWTAKKIALRLRQGEVIEAGGFYYHLPSKRPSEAPEPLYRVLTLDPELDRFTRQKGVRAGPYKLWALRGALRKLQRMGYGCGRNDPAVLVEAIDQTKGDRS